MVRWIQEIRTNSRPSAIWIPDNLQPLTQLTGKGVKFFWCGECQAAFDQLKHLLKTAPVLARLDPLTPIAFGVGLGAVLRQGCFCQPDADPARYDLLWPTPKSYVLSSWSGCSAQ